MGEIEKRIQAKIAILKEFLPKHKSSWEKLLQEIKPLLQILAIQSEEIIHVESVQCVSSDIDNLLEIQSKLIGFIGHEIALTLCQLQDKIANLKRLDNDMKNQIDKFIKSSMELEWTPESKIFLGDFKQPQLNELITFCSDYRTFFIESSERILYLFNNMDIRNRESVQAFKEYFKANFTDSDNISFLLKLLKNL